MSQQRQRGRDQRRRAQLATAVAPATSQVTPGSVVGTLAVTAQPTNSSVAEATANASDGQLVRRDLVKVFIVVAVVIGVLIALVLTNRSTGWLDRMAGELYRWLHLG